MKKFVAAFLASVLALSLMAGCGASGAASTSAPPEGSSGAPAGDGQVYEVIFAHGNSPDTPHHQAAEAFKKVVEEKSGGRITVNLFHSNSLGSAMECFEALQNGSMQVTFVPTARLSGYAPELQIFDLPFLFPDAASRFKVLDSDIGQDLLAGLAKQQVIPIGFYDDGAKQMTANKPLVSLADFKGVKFRTMESPIIMEQYRALGAEPIAIEYSELYNALQMKVADGQENPLMQIYTNKYYEVQSHLMLTSHAALSGVLMYSESWFQALPQDLQQIMMDAGKQWIQDERSGIAKMEETWLNEIKASGTTVVELTPEQLDAFEQATASVAEIYRKDYGSDILDRIKEAVKS